MFLIDLHEMLTAVSFFVISIDISPSLPERISLACEQYLVTLSITLDIKITMIHFDYTSISMALLKQNRL